MGSATPDAELFVESARRFTHILADASSLIVLADIGALEAAADTWQIVTIPEAAEEAGPILGYSEPLSSLIQHVTTYESPLEAKREGSRRGTTSTDRLLLKTALHHQWPLLSEDRKILMAAEEAGLDCLDSLVAIELLQGFSVEGPQSYSHWRQRILERNKYTTYRLSWAEQVARAIQKLL